MSKLPSISGERVLKRWSVYQPSPIPDQYSWPSLLKKDGDELFDHYRHSLEKLGNEKGLLGLIFQQVSEQVPRPCQAPPLDRGLIDKEDWSSMKRKTVSGTVSKSAGRRK